MAKHLNNIKNRNEIQVKHRNPGMFLHTEIKLSVVKGTRRRLSTKSILKLFLN